MDQQVFSNGFSEIRLVHQSVDDQQNFIMADDNNQQHIVYSPVKTNEIPQMQQQHQHPAQFISQDDSMGNQYLIQQTSSPQVFYTNISPPNQNANRIVQQVINPNLMQQQNQPKQLVLQTPQKVVVQRAPEMIQSNPNLTQLVDQQNQQTMQYNFQQNPVDQNHQIIIHQQPNQMKQTIYPQQGGQIISQQPQFIQLQPIHTQNAIVQQGTKIIMQNNSPLRCSIVQQKPPQQMQQIQNQQGQIIQIQQTQNDQTPKFRPRLAFNQMRITRTINSPQMQVQSSPQQQQQQQLQTPRPRTQRMITPRLIRPVAQSPLQQQQNTPQNSPQPARLIQANRLTPNVNNGQPQQQQQFILVQQEGQHFLVSQPMNSVQNQAQITGSPNQQLVRTIINRKIEQSPHQQNQNQQNVNANQNFQMQNAESQEQNSNQSEQVAPTTSTLIRKEGDCDDLEDSITATAISKGTRPEPGNQMNNSMSNENFRRQSVPQQQTPQRVGIVRPMMTNQGMAINRLPVQRSPSLQIIRQRTPPRPQFQQQHGIRHELGVSERESAKMLVILDNGEQRLITFTLPRETCTVQELLDQVGIEIGAESNIECIENPGSEIDYIVKVGNFGSRDTTEMTKAAENHIRQQAAQQKMTASQQQKTVQQQVNEPTKSPEPSTKLPPPKYVEGFYAVCSACGFSGSDHAKCERCHRIFTEDVKTVRMPSQLAPNTKIALIAGPPQQKLSIVKASQDRKDQMEAIQKKHQLAAAEAHRKQIGGRGRGGLHHIGNPSLIAVRGRGRANTRKPIHHEIVTLSSDDETDSDGTKSHNSKSSGDKKDQETPKKAFEPEIVDDVVPNDFIRLDVTEFQDGEDKVETSLTCRTIRIGSYKFETKDSVAITSKGIKIVAPSVKDVNDLTVLNIQNSEIVKLVTHFSKQLSIVFLYTKPSCGRFIVDQLSMTQVNDKSPYYSPLSRNETLKKIIFLTENVSEETKSALKAIFKEGRLEDISNRDANEMLVRSTGIPLTGAVNNQNTNSESNSNNSTQEGSELQKLMTYPRGRGGITVTVYDYLCLGSDNYLNDVIMDFYLKYIHTELLTKEQQQKTHIFSTFFYKRLTTMTKDQRTLTAAQKRHQRVQSWTKNVNLFEKDFIIIPINEQSHWFLAIICFPNLTEPHTMDTNQPIKLTFNQKKPKKKLPVQIGSTTITPLSKKDESIEVHDDQTSERDEAEGDDSELGSNADSEEEEVIDKGQPVKVPCILIFDSLGGTSRARVVATLRDYLTCEYKAKYPNSPPRQYTKPNMLGCLVKVPQQQNFTDCGLFLLQYVEQFFKDPLKDFRIPIKTLSKWFHQDIVTRKREDVANLIKTLMKREGFADVDIPNIEFPTKDGKILEVNESQIETNNSTMEDAFEDPDYTPSEEDQKDNSSQEEVTKKVYLPSKKRVLDKSDSNGESSAPKNPKIIKNKV